MTPTHSNQPIDSKEISSETRRLESLAHLTARIRAAGGDAHELGVAILATTDRFALGDLWRSLCGGAP